MKHIDADEMNSLVSTTSAKNFTEDFDPAGLIEQAIQADLNPSVFDQINETDIPRAKNWLDWCLGKEFMNLTPGPFGRQIQIAINLLLDYCPWCSDRKFAEDIFNPPITEILDRIVMFEYGVCPKCKRTRTEAIVTGEFKGPPVTLAAALGMRSGKTTVAGMIFTYHLHRFLMLGSPSRFYGLMANQMLHMTFVAITAGQAYDTLWTAFKDQYNAAPWYTMYNNFLKHEAKRLGIDPATLFDVKDTFIWYGGQKNLTCSFQGADIRTIRGRTRFASGIDELGWFDQNVDSGKVRANADETHHALIKSLKTIRASAFTLRERGLADVPDGYDCSISSPSSKNDKIMRLIYESKEDPTIYSAHYATWEANPNVPLSSLKAEMRDRVIFDRDYGAIPPLADSQFLSDDKSVEKSHFDPPQGLNWVEKNTTDDFGDTTIYLEVSAISDKSHPCILTVDTGLSNNSFAVAVTRYNKDLKNTETIVALEVQPKKSADGNMAVNFPLMFEKCILPLCDAYNVIYAVYDRWNSVDQVQRLKDRKIQAEQYSLTYQDFLNFRTKFYDNAIKTPRSEKTIKEIKNSKVKFEQLIEGSPHTHLALQLLTVREIGRKITKPLGGTDDLFRCVVLAATFIFNPELTKKFESGTASGTSRSKGIGAVRSNFTGSVTRTVAKSGNSKSSIGVRKSFK